MNGLRRQFDANVEQALELAQRCGMALIFSELEFDVMKRPFNIGDRLVESIFSALIAHDEVSALSAFGIERVSEDGFKSVDDLMGLIHTLFLRAQVLHVSPQY